MTKHDAILKAADQLFSQYGYGLTGVDALAAAAGVTKRTLYKQFGSKEGLFVAWLRLRDARTRASLIGAVGGLSDQPKGQLLALFSVLATLADNPNFHGCPFSRALIEFSSPEADNAGRLVAAEHKAALADWFTERLVAAGIEDVAAVCEEISTLYEGTLMRVAMTRTPDAALAARRMLEMRLASSGHSWPRSDPLHPPM
jgi:AcrR family transcriptional regulator